MWELQCEFRLAYEQKRQVSMHAIEAPHRGVGGEGRGRGEGLPAASDAIYQHC